MRAIVALLCLFSGAPDDDAAESVGRAQEPKVERYRALLTELASSGTALQTKAPIDLPAGLKEAIETWTGQ
ncbi:hypothetical protein [Microvirga calopogonii]|uniref:hypothetical protein n=1 Tax=Microvirga calopogonii TaxID=2078013 RepID=UPI000E0D34F5|nr:hypothetical protein [Microvirga calopogonii]